MKQQPYDIDLNNAQRHRNKDNSSTNPFYDRQAQILEGAPFGVPLPKEVITGGLPQGRLSPLYEWEAHRFTYQEHKEQ